MKRTRKTRKYMKGGLGKKQVQGFIGQLKEKLSSGLAVGIRNFTSKMINKKTKCFPVELKNRVVTKLGSTVQDLVKDLSDKGLNVAEKVLYSVPVMGNVASIVSAGDTALAAAQNAKNNMIDIKHEVDFAEHEMTAIKEKMHVVEQLKRKQEQMESQLNNRFNAIDQGAISPIQTPNVPQIQRGGTKKNHSHHILNRTHKSIYHFQSSTTGLLLPP